MRAAGARKEASEWDIDEVCSFLYSLGLTEAGIEEIVRTNLTPGRHLLSMTDDQLFDELGLPLRVRRQYRVWLADRNEKQQQSNANSNNIN